MQPNENGEYTFNTSEVECTIEDERVDVEAFSIKFENIETSILEPEKVLNNTEFYEMAIVENPPCGNTITIYNESCISYDIKRFIRWLFPRQFNEVTL